jgi:hypothetical protein
MVAALENAYAAIRRRHPELPEVVIVIASGSGRKGLEKLGHFAAMRWQDGDERVAELMIAGEGLNNPAEVMHTLLHEAAHGLARVRGIQDTARQGRMHNYKFAVLATELGLVPPAKRSPRNGYSDCYFGGATAKVYAAEIERLKAALKLYRHAEAPRESKARKDSNNGVRATCSPDCGRSIRVAPSVLAQGAIICGCCSHPFTAPGIGETIEDE